MATGAVEDNDGALLVPISSLILLPVGIVDLTVKAVQSVLRSIVDVLDSVIVAIVDRVNSLFVPSLSEQLAVVHSFTSE